MPHVFEDVQAEELLIDVVAYLTAAHAYGRSPKVTREVLEHCALVATQVLNALETRNQALKLDIDRIRNLIVLEFMRTVPRIVVQTDMVHRIEHHAGTVERSAKGGLTEKEVEYLLELKVDQPLLNEATLDLVVGVHDGHVVSDEDFTLLLKESNRLAIEKFGKGGLLERSVPTPVEQEHYARYGKYESPSAFYRRLLLDGDPSMGEVIVLATPDARNLCILRLPPHDPEARREFGLANECYFRESHWPQQNRKQSLDPLYADLMEVSLIACKDRGVPSELLFKGLEYAEKDNRNVQGVFLEHFSHVRRLLPTPDMRVVSDIENKSSEKFFLRLGAGVCCQRNGDHAFREIGGVPGYEGIVIGADVSWDVRFVEMRQYEHNLRNELAKNRSPVSLERLRRRLATN